MNIAPRPPPVEFVIAGLRLVSEANAHEYWRVRQKRAKAQRSTAKLHTQKQICIRPALKLPIVVTITRIAPRSLDSDNAVGSCKHVRDGVADALGVNDRNPAIEWVVRQEKGAPNSYAVRVRLEVV